MVGVVCVWEGGGRDEAISKLRGAGATRALPRSYLHMSCLPWPARGIFLILYANSVRNSLEANSEHFQIHPWPPHGSTTAKSTDNRGVSIHSTLRLGPHAPRSTKIICAAHRLSRTEIIGIHGDFGIMILILRL